MGIRFYCPDCGRRLNIKSFLAGKRGICPHCDSRVMIPLESQLPTDAPKYRPTSDDRVTTASASTKTKSAPVEHQATIQPLTAPVSTDLIADSPESVWYVRPAAGGQFGPARGDVMQRWLAEGRVSADSMVWQEGWDDWKLAGPLFPSLDATPSSTSSESASSVPSFVVPGDEEQDISKPVAAPDLVPKSIAEKPSRIATRRSRSLAPLIVLGLLIVALLVVTVVILQRT
jgi:DNA-directed RNA polymerase subunit RPC12/RpoP